MCVGECNFRQDGQEKPMVSICNSFPEPLSASLQHPSIHFHKAMLNYKTECDNYSTGSEEVKITSSWDDQRRHH